MAVFLDIIRVFVEIRAEKTGKAVHRLVVIDV